MLRTAELLPASEIIFTRFLRLWRTIESAAVTWYGVPHVALLCLCVGVYVLLGLNLQLGRYHAKPQSFG